MSSSSRFQDWANCCLQVSHLQERHNAIPRNGLQQAGGAGETLQPRTTAGEEGANHYDPGGGPRQGPDDEVPLHRVAKPEMKNIR